MVGNKKILLLGDTGLLGSEFKKLGVDYSMNRSTLNIYDLNTIPLKEFDICLNCIAYTNVDLAENESKEMIYLNSTFPGLLGQQDKCKIIHFSTDYVFSNKEKNNPFNELDTPNPINAYGFYKLEGERNLLTNLNSLVIRTSWLFGKSGFPFKILDKLKNNELVNVTSSQIGTPTCSFELAKSVFNLIEKNNLLDESIIHLSGKEIMSWYDFALKIADKVSKKNNIVETNYIEQKAMRPKYSPLTSIFTQSKMTDIDSILNKLF